MCYAERIKRYLDESGIKYGVVAEKIDVSLSTFSAMMNNRRKITIDEYVKICRSLDKPVDFFTGSAA